VFPRIEYLKYMAHISHSILAAYFLPPYCVINFGPILRDLFCPSESNTNARLSKAIHLIHFPLMKRCVFFSFLDASCSDHIALGFLGTLLCDFVSLFMYQIYFKASILLFSIYESAVSILRFFTHPFLSIFNLITM
jgi:hypothetical protein